MTKLGHTTLVRITKYKQHNSKYPFILPAVQTNLYYLQTRSFLGWFSKVKTSFDVKDIDDGVPIGNKNESCVRFLKSRIFSDYTVIEYSMNSISDDAG